jgi:hypothetical protein
MNRFPRFDFYVPQLRQVIEFDETQHFSRPREITLNAYGKDAAVNYSVGRWMALCRQHRAQDKDPPYRDEQRAWYDTLRDLAPPIHDLRPIIRIYGNECRWCSLDPNKTEDVERVKRLLNQYSVESVINTSQTLSAELSETRGQLSRVSFRVALVFPPTWSSSVHGKPANTPASQNPEIPQPNDFCEETVDLVVFPEGYVRTTDNGRLERLNDLSNRLHAHLLVGAVKPRSIDGKTSQVLLLFAPGKEFEEVYAKHSTAEIVAFEQDEWSPEKNLRPIEIDNIKIGVTLCHDQYLGLLQKYLVRQGIQLWINPSYDNVVEEKWAAILRL